MKYCITTNELYSEIKYYLPHRKYILLHLSPLVL